jgi:hypothetical protein
MIAEQIESAELHSPAGPFRFLAFAVLSSIAVGLLVITATVLVVDTLRPPGGNEAVSGAFYVLVFGTLAGVLLAAFVCWYLLAPIQSTYRRGALSIVCAFATVLAMLVCIPVNQLLGRTGLAILLVACGVIAGVLAHRARRLGVAE